MAWRRAGRGSAGDLRRAVCLLLRSGRLGLPLCHRPGGRGPAGVTRALNQALSGRGGGKPGFVQGSVQAEQTAIRDFFAAL